VDSKQIYMKQVPVALKQYIFVSRLAETVLKLAFNTN